MIVATANQTNKTRTGQLGSKTFDPTTRQFECVVTTQAPCPSTRIVDGKEIHVLEILLASGCRNVDKLGGLPLLDAHDRSSNDKNIGHIVAGKSEGDKISATVQLSARAARFDDDIASGGINKVSAGYSTRSSGDILIPLDNGPTLCLCTDWELAEVSIVPVPADQDAVIRARAKEQNKMTETEVRALVDAAIKSVIPEIVNQIRAATAPTGSDPFQAKKPVVPAKSKGKKGKKASASRDDGDDGDEQSDESGTDGEDEDMDDERAVAAALATRSAADRRAIEELQVLADERGVDVGLYIRHGAPVAAISAKIFENLGKSGKRSKTSAPDEFVKQVKGETKVEEKLIDFNQRGRPINQTRGVADEIQNTIASSIAQAFAALKTR